MNLDKHIAKYENELFASVIPFWENNCVDKDFGGYFTCLDRDGAVYDTEKYMWMQWRIVYMFATLSMTEYREDRWLDIAAKGYDFLVANGKDPDGFYYFALNRKGTPSMAPYSIFSDCFAAMGAAALYKATGVDKYKKEADSAMRNYISRMDNPKGRWEKGLSGRPKRLNLGHYMILANLGCVMKECLGTDEYEVDTKNAVETVIDRFWNSDKKVVFENINSDGSFDLDSCDGRHVIPGHGLESMWFIMRYAEKCGRRDLIEKACEQTLGLLDFGWDNVFGGIYYFMDALGKPHVELQANMKLWWVHNEALIAALYAYKLTGKKTFVDWFEKIDKWTWSRFPDPEFGEWFGYLDRPGEPTHLLKGGKWKTFFHLPRFLLVSLEQMRSITGKKIAAA
jgi:N-acylglucosamine 2-epimerase